MTITYNHRYPTNIDEVKHKFQSLLGNDIIIFQRQSGRAYHKPIRTTVSQVVSEFVVCNNKANKRECFKYSEFYSGNLIYDKVVSR